jgi:hypothetical protein
MKHLERTWFVPQDSVKAELRRDVTTSPTAILAAATRTDGASRRQRSHRSRPLMNFLRPLTDTVGELIDVNIGRFLVPREPGWEMHREVSCLCLLARKLCRAVVAKNEGVGKCRSLIPHGGTLLSPHLDFCFSKTRLTVLTKAILLSRIFQMFWARS